MKIQKKTKLKTIFVSLIFTMLCFSPIFPIMQYGRADWTPSDTQLAPSIDTFVSIGGTLAEPLSNFGGSETLYVGKGLYGYSVSAIEFDLSKLPENIASLQFKSEMVVYGENTRTLQIYIMEDIPWIELEVTGSENPFNATDICFTSGSVGNLTHITITGSTSEMTIDLGDYKSESGKITLIFTTGALDESWFTMQSKENQYLTSISNPPRLEFTVDSSSDTNGDTDTSGSGGSILGAFFVIVIIGGIIFLVIKKKKKKAAEMA